MVLVRCTLSDCFSNTPSLRDFVRKGLNASQKALISLSDLTTVHRGQTGFLSDKHELRKLAWLLVYMCYRYDSVIVSHCTNQNAYKLTEMHCQSTLGTPLGTPFM